MSISNLRRNENTVFAVWGTFVLRATKVAPRCYWYTYTRLAAIECELFRSVDLPSAAWSSRRLRGNGLHGVLEAEGPADAGHKLVLGRVDTDPVGSL